RGRGALASQRPGQRATATPDQRARGDSGLVVLQQIAHERPARRPPGCRARPDHEHAERRLACGGDRRSDMGRRLAAVRRRGWSVQRVLTNLGNEFKAEFAATRVKLGDPPDADSNATRLDPWLRRVWRRRDSRSTGASSLCATISPVGPRSIAAGAASWHFITLRGRITAIGAKAARRPRSSMADRTVMWGQEIRNAWKTSSKAPLHSSAFVEHRLGDHPGPVDLFVQYLQPQHASWFILWQRHRRLVRRRGHGTNDQVLVRKGLC